MHRAPTHTHTHTHTHIHTQHHIPHSRRKKWILKYSIFKTWNCLCVENQLSVGLMCMYSIILHVCFNFFIYLFILFWVAFTWRWEDIIFSEQFFDWRLIALQCCVGFCHTMEVSHFIYVYVHIYALAWRIPWTEEPGGLHSPWDHKESDMTEWLTLSKRYIYIYVCVCVCVCVCV